MYDLSKSDLRFWNLDFGNDYNLGNKYKKPLSLYIQKKPRFKKEIQIENGSFVDNFPDEFDLTEEAKICRICSMFMQYLFIKTTAPGLVQCLTKEVMQEINI